MKVLVLPRDDQNRYQRLLYGEMRRLGVRISYLGRLTPSHTLNVLLLPVELVAGRVAGARLIHLHWVYTFALPGASRYPATRRLAQAWFSVWLRTVRLLGLRLVWTAHNVLPHAQVFADDAAARRTLTAASDLVIAHSPAALAGLAELGAVPRRSVVIPHGPLPATLAAGSLRAPGSGAGPRQFLFFGQVHEYKGVEDLLAAFAGLPGSLDVRLTVAGHCPDPGLRSRLQALAGRCGGRVRLRLQRVPEDEVTPLLAAADAVVLPYRQITTSGTAMLALAHGRPLIVPDVPGFAGLSRQAVIAYDRTGPGLIAALTRLAQAPGQALAAMSAAALASGCDTSWPEIAARTTSEMGMLLTGRVAEGPAGGAARCV